MSEVVTALSTRARRKIVESGVGLENALNQVLDEAVESELGTEIASQEPHIRSELSQQLSALGPLQPLLDDPSIEEIWINDNSSVFVAKSGKSEKLAVAIAQQQLQTLVEKMLRHTGRRIDRSSPFVDASLEDGSRLHVAIPDVTKEHWSVNIRKFPRTAYSLHDLVELGTLNKAQAYFLEHQVAEGKNILVSGATQAGKTTMLCALLSQAAMTERIVSVEETFELRFPAVDWVALQTRQANLEGHGEVSLRRLVKEALRMRPERIVVGEVRQAESFDLLIALNSGLPGMCTIHANSAIDAVSKLCTLPLLAGPNISSDFVRPAVGNCIDFVVHCRLLPTGERIVEDISSVSWDQPQSKILVEKVDL